MKFTVGVPPLGIGTQLTTYIAIIMNEILK
jgi:hypothetical protein